MSITPPRTFDRKELEKFFIKICHLLSKINFTQLTAQQIEQILLPLIDTTAPPMPMNLRVNGGMKTISLQWDTPVYAYLAYTEIWRTTSNELTKAELVGIATGYVSDFADKYFPDPTIDTYYYWIRFVSVGKVVSPFNDNNGTKGVTHDVVSELQGKIGRSEIYADLMANIDESFAIIQVVDGIKSKYAVKVNSEGHVAGFELMSDGTTSDFGIAADKFFVAAPAGQTGKIPIIPFIVDTANNRVAMDGAYIKTASISVASIENLIVGTNVSMGAGSVITWGNLQTTVQNTINTAAQTASWGNVSSRPANVVALTGAEAIQNTAISLNANGTISGAGGGQVTIGGLGYTGALNANYTTNTNQLADGAGLGTTAVWSGVSGTGKPQDNANYTTNTNQLTDGAGLGQTANWLYVSGRPNTTYIDAYGIYTGTLTAAQVNAVAINAGSVTSGTFTGLVLQTAASGERFVVDVASKAAHFYDANNVQRAWIGTAAIYGNTWASFGGNDAANARTGIEGLSYNGAGTYGYSAGSAGIGAVGAGQTGVYANGFGTYAGYCDLNLITGIVKWGITSYPTMLPNPNNYPEGTMSVYRTSTPQIALCKVEGTAGSRHWLYVDGNGHSQGCPT